MTADEIEYQENRYYNGQKYTFSLEQSRKVMSYDIKTLSRLIIESKSLEVAAHLMDDLKGHMGIFIRMGLITFDESQKILGDVHDKTEIFPKKVFNPEYPFA